MDVFYHMGADLLRCLDVLTPEFYQIKMTTASLIA